MRLLLRRVLGYQLIRRVRERPADRGGRIPAVAVSGSDGAEDITKILAADFQKFIGRPFAQNPRPTRRRVIGRDADVGRRATVSVTGSAHQRAAWETLARA